MRAPASVLSVSWVKKNKNTKGKPKPVWRCPLFGHRANVVLDKPATLLEPRAIPSDGQETHRELPRNSFEMATLKKPHPDEDKPVFCLFYIFFRAWESTSTCVEHQLFQGVQIEHFGRNRYWLYRISDFIRCTENRDKRKVAR